MGDGLEVRGGYGGVAANIVDVRRVAGELDRVGDVLRDLADRARHLTTSGDLLASAALSPGSAASAQAQLLDAAFGPRGLLPQAVGVEAAAVGLRAVAEAFETRDEAVAGLVDGFQATVGYATGRVVGGVGVPLGLAAAVVALGAHTLQEHAEQDSLGAVWRYVRGQIDRDELERHLANVGGEAMRDLTAPIERLLFDPTAFRGGAGADADEDAPPGFWARELNELLMTFPELTDTVIGGGPSLVRGVRDSGVFQPFLLERLGIDVPRTFEEMTADLLTHGSRFGLFDDTREIQVTERAGSTRAVALDGVAAIFEGQTSLHTTVKDDHDRSAIRVIRAHGPGGGPRWVVQVPGTQEWPPLSGRDPSDLTTNLMLEAYQDAALLDAIAEAMDLAGVGSTDPVMITGHSQGGIAAVSFAAAPDMRDRFNVTHVITGGSPVARIDLPSDVQLLALEHDQDPVPRLEGDPNRDVPNVTTVVRRLDPADAGTPIGAHASRLYAETGALVDGSTDPSIEDFLDSAADFLVESGTATDYHIERTDP